MPTHGEILDFYSSPAAMTAAGDCAPLLQGLPAELPAPG